jgi:GNAT superfamily N-acetyltransferase
VAIDIEAVTDLDAVWPELSALSIELTEYHRPWFNRRLRDDWEQRWRDYVELGDDRLILLARDAGEAVAYFSVMVRRDYGLFDELVGFIDDAYVKPAYRSSGLGRRLLRRTEAWCKERGAPEVRLNVVAGNKLGVRFWTLSGFELQSMNMRKSLERPS